MENKPLTAAVMRFCVLNDKLTFKATKRPQMAHSIVIINFYKRNRFTETFNKKPTISRGFFKYTVYFLSRVSAVADHPTHTEVQADTVSTNTSAEELTVTSESVTPTFLHT